MYLVCISNTHQVYCIRLIISYFLCPTYYDNTSIATLDIFSHYLYTFCVLLCSLDDYIIILIVNHCYFSGAYPVLLRLRFIPALSACVFMFILFYLWGR